MKKYLVWLINLPMVTLWVLLVGGYAFWSDTPGSEYYAMQYVWLALILIFGLLGWIYYALLKRAHLLPHKILQKFLSFCNYYTALFPTVALFLFSNVFSDRMYKYLTGQACFKTFSYYSSAIFLFAQLTAIILLLMIGLNTWRRRRRIPS